MYQFTWKFTSDYINPKQASLSYSMQSLFQTFKAKNHFNIVSLSFDFRLKADKYEFQLNR